MSYFELFDLSEDYYIDTSYLTELYQEKQKECHPDRFTAASDQEKLKALQLATETNNAYQTLKDPIRRAVYLLTLKGIDVNNEVFTLQDNQFLTHQFELREKLETLTDNRSIEKKDQLVELTLIIQQISQEERKLKNQLYTEIENDAWENAADCIRKLRYYERLLEQVDQIQDQLDFS